MSQNLTNISDQLTSSSIILLIRHTLYISYIIFGTPAVCANLFTLFVILSDGKLRLKSALIVGLAGGNLFNGVHAFGYGVYRLPLLLAGTIDLPTNIWWCMASLMPTCYLLGFSLPATIQFVSGLERLVAIGAFNWYRIHWSSRKTWYMVGCVYLVTICAWVLPTWYRAISDQTITVTRECSSSVTIPTSIFHCLTLFIIAAGVAAVLCLLSAVLIGYNRFRKLKSSLGITLAELSQFKSQLRVSKMMLIVAMCELCLVVLPNIILVLSSFYPKSISPLVSIYAIDIYCINSISNIFIYHGMNSAFRKAALRKFGWLFGLCRCKCVDVNAVQPISVGNGI